MHILVLSVGHLLKTKFGTFAYLAPEVIEQDLYDGYKADMWSFGVTLYVMTTGKLPWVHENVTLQAQEILNVNYTIPNSVPEKYRKIISMLLQKDPLLRPDAETLLRMLDQKIAILVPLVRDARHINKSMPFFNRRVKSKLVVRQRVMPTLPFFK